MATTPAASTERAAPPGSRADAASARFEELEAYRGIAALLVVVFHAYQYSKQALGLSRYAYEGTPLHILFGNFDGAVACFFTLSGFLLFLPFARAALNGRSAPSARGFLVRRAIRILPTYYLAILVVWTWRYTGYPGQWADLAEHLTFTHIFDRAHTFWTIGPAWSLADEAIFYAALAALGPALCALCERLRTPFARVAVLASAPMSLALASGAYKWWAFVMAHVPLDDSPIYFGPLAKLDTFAIGMLLAVAATAARGRVPLRGPARRALLGGAVLVILTAAAAARAEFPLIDLYFHTLCGLGFALLLTITVLGPRGSGLERLLRLRPLQSLGLISYSVYLWHEPLMLELGRHHLLIQSAPQAFPRNAALLVLLAIAVATLSYLALEWPTQLLRHLFSRDGRLANRYGESNGGDADAIADVRPIVPLPTPKAWDPGEAFTAATWSEERAT
ncbi:MAG TPA: acyltransferase [Chloroflexota bacterium]